MAKAIDPVCDTEVDTKTAFKSEYKDKTYYFCSKDDKNEFDMHPTAYTGKQKEKVGSSKESC